MARKLEQLKEIYDSLPTMECKGLCADECSIVFASNVEKALIRSTTHRPVAFNTTDRRSRSCPYLVDGRCSIYEVRPLLCRIFGMIEPGENYMLCRYGCKPSRWMSSKEGWALAERARQLMGFDPKQLNIHAQGPVSKYDAEAHWQKQLKMLEEHGTVQHDLVECSTCAAIRMNTKKVREILKLLAKGLEVKP